jgi:hypothetical protein
MYGEAVKINLKKKVWVGEWVIGWGSGKEKICDIFYSFCSYINN